MQDHRRPHRAGAPRALVATPRDQRRLVVGPCGRRFEHSTSAAGRPGSDVASRRVRASASVPYDAGLATTRCRSRRSATRLPIRRRGVVGDQVMFAAGSTRPARRPRAVGAIRGATRADAARPADGVPRRRPAPRSATRCTCSAAATASASSTRSSASTRTGTSTSVGTLPGRVVRLDRRDASATPRTSSAGTPARSGSTPSSRSRPRPAPRVVAHLPVGLRYAAVGAAGGRLVIAGGTTPTAHATTAIYVVRSRDRDGDEDRRPRRSRSRTRRRSASATR